MIDEKSAWLGGLGQAGLALGVVSTPDEVYQNVGRLKLTKMKVSGFGREEGEKRR
jgi:hypothetical protein